MAGATHVLVVDDNGPVRSLLARALRAHGYSVEEADTGPNAIRIALEVVPAVAIVDQFMPDMTGAELIRHLRAAAHPQLRRMPIIGLSGRAGSERDLLGAGAGTFLRKPFHEAELIAAVEDALRSAKAGPDPGCVPA